jgi:glycine/D-amino acid oxidase-like deaminating enzyme
MTKLDFDVAVLGGGSAGCIAALASARAGARTVLVDRLPFPGGTSTATLDTFYAFFTAGSDGRKVVSGLPDLPVQMLRDRGVLRERPNSFGSGLGYTYDPETLKLVWARLLREAGVSTLLHSVVADAEIVGDRVTHAIIAGRSGMVRLHARTFVDATGDADLVARAGGSMQTDTELTQPATLTFRMAPVDVSRFREFGRPQLKDLVLEGRRAGLNLPGNGGSLHESGIPGTVLTALTRVPAPDLDDPEAPGRMEIDALLQVEEWAHFLSTRMPGFEDARISAIGSMTGVRETRRILGRQVLTEDDVVSGRQYDDQVALCGAPIEDLSTATTRWRHVGGSGVYGLMWSALLPATLEGVVVAGRCLSATHAAHASARSMGTCMAMGQAAGTAAALAARRNCVVGDVPFDLLRDRLTRTGATLEDAA